MKLHLADRSAASCMLASVRAAAVVLSLALASPVWLHAATVIKLGSLAPEGSPWDKALRQMAADWSTASSGTVTLKIYPGGIAGDENDMIRKMRIGQLGGAGITAIGMCRIQPDILALLFPMTIRTDAEFAYVLSKVRADYEAMLEKEGFKVLVWSFVGWTHFFARQPVVNPEDLQKQKLFIWAGGDQTGPQTWKDMGFHVIPLQATDIMASLQGGMIDAFTATALSAASFQWFAYAKNMCSVKWAPLVGGIVVSKSVWDKIPAELRPRLEASARAMGETLGTEVMKADLSAIEIMKKNGLVVNPSSPEAEKKWLKVVEDGAPKIVGKAFSVEAYNTIKKHLADFRNGAR